MKTFIRHLLTLAIIALPALMPLPLQAQELEAKVVINSQKIQGTNKEVFKTLETALTEFLNNRKWTNQQYAQQERIVCSFNITVNQYSDDGSFVCDIMVQSNRPVFNSSYNSTVFNFKDTEFAFNYKEFDQLEFKEDIIDNNLTAVMAYYALLIIGLDMDTMAPQGGTEVLQRVSTIVTNAEMLNATGWKAFDSDRNRHAIINDYMDGGMAPLRQLMYDYYRKGLDEMATNAERGRTNITTALAKLKEAKENKALSALPVIWTDIKKDELANIYSKGTQKEKEEISAMLSEINPSQSTSWNKIKNSR
ncbi:MAG: DUF4835 family protein [Bacteroidaceae bacterium]|nr:DUF4835 family protein [Bacteroidaceae bacterium]MBR3759234.1 DUF4835 family protein [Bacteroidaceae bacterium]